VLGALRSQCPLVFNFGELKLRNLTKLWVFFQADYDEIKLQKVNYDVILVT